MCLHTYSGIPSPPICACTRTMEFLHPLCACTRTLESLHPPHACARTLESPPCACTCTLEFPPTCLHMHSGILPPTHTCLHMYSGIPPPCTPKPVRKEFRVFCKDLELRGPRDLRLQHMLSRMVRDDGDPLGVKISHPVHKHTWPVLGSSAKSLRLALWELLSSVHTKLFVPRILVPFGHLCFMWERAILRFSYSFPKLKGAAEVLSYWDSSIMAVVLSKEEGSWDAIRESCCSRGLKTGE